MRPLTYPDFAMLMAMIAVAPTFPPIFAMGIATVWLLFGFLAVYKQK